MMPMIRPVPRLVRPEDASYFRKRAVEEQIAAQKTAFEPARKRHDELATMYRFRATMLADPLALDNEGACSVENVE